MVYLNWKGPQGRETVDELDRKDYESNKAFRAELYRLIREYGMAGMSVYSSSRMCANWKDK